MKEGFKRHSIVVLDGIMQLLQNYFLLISAFYLVMTYINMFYPCFTVVLYNDALVPRQFWSVLGTIQYVLPLIVLLQIEVPAKIYLYWLIYPVFMYSWDGFIAMRNNGFILFIREACSFRLLLLHVKRK